MVNVSYIKNTIESRLGKYSSIEIIPTMYCLAGLAPPAWTFSYEVGYVYEHHQSPTGATESKSGVPGRRFESGPVVPT